MSRCCAAAGEGPREATGQLSYANERPARMQGETSNHPLPLYMSARHDGSCPLAGSRRRPLGDSDSCQSGTDVLY